MRDARGEVETLSEEEATIEDPPTIGIDYKVRWNKTWAQYWIWSAVMN